MVLIQWLERGLGQILAPDKNYIPNPDAVDTRSNFWRFVAPDPNFDDTTATSNANNNYNNEMIALQPSSTAATDSSSKSSSVVGTPEIVDISTRMSNMTVINNSGFMSPPPTTSSSTTKVPTNNAASLNYQIRENRNILMTPSPSHRNYRSEQSNKKGDDDDDDVDSRVLFTAKSLANCMASPGVARKKTDSLFRYCASSVPINEPNQKKLRKLLTTDNTLLNARCSKMGNLCPDGYSPLMAAAHANHIIAAKILWEIGTSEQLRETNLQGKTAYHIAAENGHLEVLEFLQQKYIETYGINSPPPVDLIGMTPLGVAVTSPMPNAIKNKQELYNKLFSPSDISILGSPPPIQQRVTYNTSIQVAYGVSQMPGKRILMEDSSVASSWDNGALFAVCDGHSDSGQVSKFVAESFPSKFQQIIKQQQEEEEMDWNTICKEICMSTDARLKKSIIPGGSTAVITIVTKTQIICANVGDCRCILIQRHGPEEEKTTTNEQEETSSTAESSTDLSDWSRNYKVIALSDDHKANTEIEINRIEKAGLNVIEEKFIEENGKEVCISKVALSDRNRMACSRSFGDFEYKSNSTLDDDEQAVVAVPDVTVRQRQADTNDAYLVLACDGIWDVMSNEDVGQFVVETVEQCINESNNNNESTGNNNTESTTALQSPLLSSSLSPLSGVTILPIVGDKLLQECFKRGSADNLSCIIVAMNTKIIEKLGIPQGKALHF